MLGESTWRRSSPGTEFPGERAPGCASDELVGDMADTVLAQASPATFPPQDPPGDAPGDSPGSRLGHLCLQRLDRPGPRSGYATLA